MKPPIVKVKLQGLRFPHPLYKIVQIVGAVTINTSKGNFRVTDSFDEAVAQELTQNRNYLVTVTPGK